MDTWKRTTLFAVFVLAGLFLFRDNFAELARMTLLKGHAGEPYSHILMIPIISAYLFWLKRKTILSQPRVSIVAGLPVVVTGFLLHLLGKQFEAALTRNDYLSLAMLAFVIGFLGGFILLYGTKAFRRGLFPLLFLVFMIPLPAFIIDPYIRILQKASAEVSYASFKGLGTPVFRSGFVFELPGFAVEVARECSGIRSSLALFITSVLAGYLFLNTSWRRILLALATFPVAVIKNGFRIVTLSLLATYVDKTFITNHWLHRSGGIPFFFLALIMLAPLFWMLRTSERKPSSKSPTKSGASVLPRRAE